MLIDLRPSHLGGSGRPWPLPLLAAALAAGLALGSALNATAADRATELFLSDGRFRISVEWTTADGASGEGYGVPLTDDTGYFWFFRASNVELTVKVLDACRSKFNKFWVSAAGMTNVQVELTVEDTVTGASMTYVNPLGILFQPVFDTSSFATCGYERECGKGSFFEIQATPRADWSAELAALAIGGGLTADEGVYQRIAADLDAIRAMYPELPLTYHDAYRHTPGQLLIILEGPAYTWYEAGLYHAWDCLNAWYRARLEPAVGAHSFVVAFEGILNLDLVADDYAALPGVRWAGKDSHTYVEPGPLLPGFCAQRLGSKIRYYSRGDIDDPYAYLPSWYLASVPGSPPVLVDTHVGGPPLPAWWQDSAVCFQDEPIHP